MERTFSILYYQPDRLSSVRVCLVASIAEDPWYNNTVQTSVHIQHICHYISWDNGSINSWWVRVNNCCLAPTQHFCSAISWREHVSFQSDDDEVRFVLDQHAELDFYSTRWNNSLQVDMSIHSDTLFWFLANQPLLFLLNAACLAEKQQIPIL